MGGGQSRGTSAPQLHHKDEQTPPARERQLERSGTVAVASTFKHQVGHEMSPEEIALVRRMVQLTSSTPTDEPGIYENKLATRVSRNTLDIAEKIMRSTQYAFNFVHHGQHQSNNIRALLDQHTDKKTAAIPHTNTKKITLNNDEQGEMEKSLEARSGLTALDLAAELRARNKKKVGQLPSIRAEPDVIEDAADLEAPKGEDEVEGKVDSPALATEAHTNESAGATKSNVPATASTTGPITKHGDIQKRNTSGEGKEGEGKEGEGKEGEGKEAEDKERAGFTDEENELATNKAAPEVKMTELLEETKVEEEPLDLNEHD